MFVSCVRLCFHVLRSPTAKNGPDKLQGVKYCKPNLLFRRRSAIVFSMIPTGRCNAAHTCPVASKCRSRWGAGLRRLMDEENQPLISACFDPLDLGDIAQETENEELEDDDLISIAVHHD